MLTAKPFSALLLKKKYFLKLQNVRKNAEVQILAITTLHPNAIKGIDHLLIFMC